MLPESLSGGLGTWEPVKVSLGSAMFFVLLRAKTGCLPIYG